MFQESFCRFRGYLKEISEKFQRCFKDIQGSVKGVERKFLKCFKEVSMVFQRSFKDASIES